jgi:hypothetical protein
VLEQLKLQKEKKFNQLYIDEQPALVRLESLFKGLEKRYSLNKQTILNLISQRSTYTAVPVSIFGQSLSPLESLTLYLKKHLSFTIPEIAKITNRNPSTIWTTLKNAEKKQKTRHLDKSILVPLTIFSDRRLSILEILSTYLYSKHDLTYHQIADLLNKDDRTIWTVINRAKKKGCTV